MRLLPRADKKGRVPAVEVMVSTGLIRECIIDHERTRYIPDSIEQGFSQYGMQSFDQSLMELLKRKLISFKEAMRRASNPDDFKLRCTGIQSTSDLAQEELAPGSGQKEDTEKLKSVPKKSGNQSKDDGMTIDFSKAFND